MLSILEQPFWMTLVRGTLCSKGHCRILHLIKDQIQDHRTPCPKPQHEVCPPRWVTFFKPVHFLWNQVLPIYLGICFKIWTLNVQSYHVKKTKILVAPSWISPRVTEAHPANVSTWVTLRPQSKGMLNSMASRVPITWDDTRLWTFGFPWNVCD